jgi:hypothetical protein
MYGLGCTHKPSPATQPSPESRLPADNVDLRFWLTDMIAYHGYTPDECAVATGLPADQIAKATRRYRLVPGQRPLRSEDGQLIVLPYPGGRHPRIGFLEGAIDPQRETKFSVFAPWPGGGYVVVDLPEAVFTDEGLIYLAHTHIPTVWTKRNIELEKLEWSRGENGLLAGYRRLPNGVSFSADVVPGHDAIRMTLAIQNSTDKPLKDVRAQVCTMFKGLAGFEKQSDEGVVTKAPYIARNATGADRWVITAWKPLNRNWSNPPVPCIHADPKFPDIAPGETRVVRGILGFYEGSDLAAEIARLEKSW